MLSYFSCFIFLIIFFTYDCQETNITQVSLEFFRDRIVNPHDFDYVFNPGYSICGKSSFEKDDVYMLIYVHTAVGNFKRRQSMRETWARRSMFRDIRIVFMMGISPDSTENQLLKLEASVYNDIVQEDFMDSYKNLTYKGIMAMKWVSKYCKHAKYVLKVDDDVMTNIFILLRHLSYLEKHNQIKPSTCLCFVWADMDVVRDPRSPWYVSKEEFSLERYGPYCAGAAYLLTGDLPSKMYKASFYIRFFWVDDFYVSGLMIRYVNATYEPLNSLFEIGQGLVEQAFIGRKSTHVVFGHFGHVLSAVNKMYTTWNYIMYKQKRANPNMGDEKKLGRLLKKNDFRILPDLKWSYNFWDEFLYPDLYKETDWDDRIQYESI